MLHRLSNFLGFCIEQGVSRSDRSTVHQNFLKTIKLNVGVVPLFSEFFGGAVLDKGRMRFVKDVTSDSIGEIQVNQEVGLAILIHPIAVLFEDTNDFYLT